MSPPHSVGRRHRRDGQSVEPQRTQGRATDKGGRSRTAISAACSPDLSPIERAYSKLKTFLRKIAERTVAGLLSALDACADIFNPGRMHKLLRGLRI
jgi:hypothetical protein